MVLEIAEYTAVAGKADEFAAGLARGLQIVQAARGCEGVELRRCIEDAHRFVALIRWATIEDHTVAFRGSPEFQAYRAQIAGLFVDPIVARHYGPADRA
ncbi:MAG: antibiotic biosynthesis monooxygenase family protein [Ktedonobacterales bacterium]